jgi:hypothetical protein
MAAMPTAAKKEAGGLKRAAIIIVGDEILKGETQVFITLAILANVENTEIVMNGKINCKNCFCVLHF